METKNYEIFMIAVPQNTQQQEDFYYFMNSKAEGCMAGGIYFENMTGEKIAEIMENILRKGVEASGIQTK